MKPIINLEFTDLDSCQKFFNKVKNRISIENILLKFKNKDYTANEIINILEEYENGVLKQ